MWSVELSRWCHDTVCVRRLRWVGLYGILQYRDRGLYRPTSARQGLSRAALSPLSESDGIFVRGERGTVCQILSAGSVHCQGVQRSCKQRNQGFPAFLTIFTE